MELIECIKRIPELLNNIVNNYENEKSRISNYIQDHKIKEIVFVASGTSMNSSKVTRYFASNGLGINVNCFYPNEFVNYFDYVNEDALYVVVSQGGSTKLVYDALNKIKANNLLNCSITEKLDSPIAKAASLSIEMGSVNEEFMYRTIGYSTTAVTCYLLEVAIAEINGTISKEKAQEYIEELKSAIDNLDNIRETTEKWYLNNKFSLMRRNKVILAGAQDFYETSNEADIKLMEMVPLMTRSFEMEELIHGPQNAFDDSTLFFILTNKDHDKEKAIHIAEFIKNEIGFGCLVGNNKIDDRDLYFELKSTNFTPIEEITAFQVIAYRMATDHGRDLARGVNTSINKYIKKTL